MSKRFAVLIGVDHYQRSGEALRAPANDVDDWSTLLTTLGFEGIRVAASPAATSTEAVDESLRWLVNAVRDAGKDALGVLFFCGHGALRSGEGNALYLSDYDGQPARSPGGPSAPLAKDGSINLEDLRIQFAAHAPQGRLVAIVDTCRNEPHPLDPGALTDGHGLAFTWKQPGYPHLLLAATERNQLSYERNLDGRWRGLLTWAATTVLGQWATAGTAGTSEYVALAPGELVRRAGQLIAAIQPASEPQAPEVVPSPEALAVPFLATAEGRLSPEPVAAPGHEWEAGSVGNIVDTPSTTTLGMYLQTVNGLLVGFTGSPPQSAYGLSFQALPVGTPFTTPVTHTTAPASWTKLTGVTPGGKYDPIEKIAVAVSDAGLKWTFWKKSAGAISSDVTITLGTTSPPAGTWYKTVDTLSPV